jgi:hypothetical protein
MKMVRGRYYLVLVVVALSLTVYGCGRTEAPKPIVLPPTPVLSVRAHWGVARAGYLRVFSEPSTDGTVEFILRSGDIVEITAKSSSTEIVRGMRDYWYHVISESQDGWAFGHGLDLYESRERAENASGLLKND